MKVVIVPIVILLFCCCKPLTASTLSFSNGTGLDDTLIQSGNISSTSVSGLLIDTQLDEDLTLFNLALDLSLEFAIYQLHGRHLDIEETMTTSHIKPKLRWDSDNDWHLDVGLGFGFLSKQYWEEINFSGQTMFALSFAVGWNLGKTDQFSVDLVYNHYSNGYTRRPNPGIDFITLNLGYVF